jgi:hypothetical protein
VMDDPIGTNVEEVLAVDVCPTDSNAGEAVCITRCRNLGVDPFERDIEGFIRLSTELPMCLSSGTLLLFISEKPWHTELSDESLQNLREVHRRSGKKSNGKG